MFKEKTKEKIKEKIEDRKKKTRIRKRAEELCEWVFSPEFDEDMKTASEEFTEKELKEIEESKYLTKDEVFDNYKTVLWEEFKKYYLPIAEDYKKKISKEQQKKLKKFQKQIKKVQKRKY